MKRFVDLAATAETWSRQQKLGEEILGYAHSFKVDALRKLGELLQGTEGAKGAAGIGKPISSRTHSILSLSMNSSVVGSTPFRMMSETVPIVASTSRKAANIVLLAAGLGIKRSVISVMTARVPSDPTISLVRS